MGLLFNIDKLRHKKDEEIPTLDVTVDDLNNLTEDIAEEDEPAIEGESEGTPKSEAVPTPEGEAAAEPDAEAEAAEEVPEVKKLVLRTDNLVKKYGKRTVANHVSIDVTQGEIVGLLGPNGAGKTTTFYMTVGLVQPNEGRIFLNDLDITKYPVYKRAQNGIGYLAQEPSVFRKLSVEDNIKAVLQMTGRSKEYQREKLENLIAEFRLEKVRKNLGDQLSGGERRRTEIARCLAIDPKFIMLDEPFAGVDPIAVEDIQSIVYKLKEKNIGILITDHNAPETLSITDRAYLLFEGRILFQGSSEELAENPTVREKYLGRNFIFRRKNFD
jgi:lipopolysaccharide export system ATP-binding protein